MFTFNKLVKRFLDSEKRIKILENSPVMGELPYKKYVAILNQTGTTAPTEIVLENTFDEDINWIYDSAGSYFASGAINGGIFNESKTIVFLSRTIENINSIIQFGFLGLLSDGSNDMITNLSIEIRLYN